MATGTVGVEWGDLEWFWCMEVFEYDLGFLEG